MEDLKKIIDSFPEKKILVIGDIMLDAWIRGIVRRVSPENQVPVLEWNGKMDYRLGGAANVAANVAALGGNVALAGFVGDDHEGNLLSDMLEKQGIKSYLGMNSVTTCKVRVEGQMSPIVRIDTEEKLEPDFEGFNSEMTEKILDYAEDADIIILSDYDKGIVHHIPREFDLFLRKTIVDSKPTNKHLYRGVRVVTPNEKELFGMVPDAESLEEAGLELQKFLGDNTQVVATLGSRGMCLFSRGEQSNLIPTFARDVADVTGAGDTVIATLGLALASGARIEDAMTLANYAAGISVSHKGTYQVKRDELISYLSPVSTKVKSLSELKKICEGLRADKKKIVFTNGCFDVLHPGHFSLLEQAKSYGEVLVVAINGDHSPYFAKKVGDSPRPIFNESERITQLSGMQAVDYVIVFQEDNPLNVISAVKPHFIVKGGRGKSEPGRVEEESNLIAQWGGQYRTIDKIGDYSTTRTLERLGKDSSQ